MECAECMSTGQVCLDCQLQAAREEGRREGYSQGHSKGYSQGYSKGLECGREVEAEAHQAILHIKDCRLCQEQDGPCGGASEAVRRGHARAFLARVKASA